MLGPAIRERLTNPEFSPFTLVLASGERIEVRHPDSVTLASVEFHGRRVFASSLTVLETREDSVIERAVSLPLIAQVVSDHKLNGSA
jgi:hypothetical protein